MIAQCATYWYFSVPAATLVLPDIYFSMHTMVDIHFVKRKIFIERVTVVKHVYCIIDMLSMKGPLIC